MTISIDTIYSWEELHGYKSYRSPINYEFGICEISLDACAPFYGHICLPSCFNEESKRFLQRALQYYTYEKHKTKKLAELFIVDIFNKIEKGLGASFAYDLGEWMAASDADNNAFKFYKDIDSIINNIQRGTLIEKIPLRIERYLALRELLDDSSGYLWEVALEPENLKTSWDKRFYKANQNLDPSETLNWWRPQTVSLRSYIMHARIAWENACVGPAPDVEELDAINLWVNTHRPKSEVIVESPRDARFMFLSPRLKKEYQKQGLIRT